MSKLQKLKIEPIGQFHYRVFLDDKEITHCVGLTINMDEPGRAPRATVRLLAEVELNIVAELEVASEALGYTEEEQQAMLRGDFVREGVTQ